MIKQGSWVWDRGQEIISASPNLSSEKPNSPVTQRAASRREFTEVESSGPLPRLQGGNVYLFVSDDYATKWLEDCPGRRQRLRLQQVDSSPEARVSGRTLTHVPLNLGVWGNVVNPHGEARNGLCECRS